MDAALQLLNRAVEADRGLAPAWGTLGTAYWVHHEQAVDAASREMAEAAQRKAFAIVPALPEGICSEGVGHFVGGDYQAAKADLELAVTRRPGYDFAWARLAAALSHLDDYPGALAAAANAVRLRPDSALYRIMLGNVHDRFAMYDAATGAYRTATELKPRSRMAWNNLGTTFLRNNQPREAAAAFNRALAIAETASTRSNLATAYYYQRDFEQALANYRRAAELSPHDPVMWGNLGDALQRAGKRDDARAAYQGAAREAREALRKSPIRPRTRTKSSGSTAPRRAMRSARSRRRPARTSFSPATRPSSSPMRSSGRSSAARRRRSTGSSGPSAWGSQNPRSSTSRRWTRCAGTRATGRSSISRDEPPARPRDRRR